MKIFNLVALAMAGALVVSIGFSMMADYLLGRDAATNLTWIVSFIVGFSARTVTEKILGYKLVDALKEKEKNNE
jgi:hydrogenase/urease accessory protein HupE